MSRFKGLTVAFEEDLREDDAERVVEAIRMVKGVGRVTSIEATSDDWINRQQIRDELGTKLWNVLYPKDQI